MTTFDWPEPESYKEAILKRLITCSDPEIQNGVLQEYRHGWPQRLNGGGSPYVLVYRVGNKIVRCFTADGDKNSAPPEDIAQRYEAIITYQQKAKSQNQVLPFLVSHEWITPGFHIQNAWYPFLKVINIDDSQNFGNFIKKEHHHPATLEKLKEQWLLLIRQLEKAKIAHGDLDLSNVLVKGRYPHLSLHLIDFDSMYVPELEQAVLDGMDVVGGGHAHFQYPPRTFGPTMDRFSALVIYISLCALAHKPVLWDTCHATESQSLLGASDFQRLAQSTNFATLRRETNNKQLQNCLDALQQSIDAALMPPALDTILRVSPAILAPYVPVVEPASDLYQGTMVPLPIEDGIDVTPTQPQPLQPQLTTQPAPTFFPTPPPTFSRTQPPSGKISWGCIAAIIILSIVIIIIIGIVIFTHQSQPGPSSSVISMVSFLKQGQVS